MPNPKLHSTGGKDLEAQHAADSEAVPHVSAQRTLALMRETTSLAPRDLEARGIIQSGMRDRKQADAFRELRTKLLGLGRARNFVTLVAPVSVGCGGSFVATNLAAAFAFDGSKSALLIDCDLRDPVLHQRLGVAPSHGGLVDLLEYSGVTVDQVIYPTGIARLRLVPAGGRRESGAEYFSSIRMRGLIDSLRARYPDRFIVIDAAPVASSPDAKILAELVDHVVLVAGFGKDTLQTIQSAVSAFDPARLAGVVFNGAPRGIA